MTPPHESAIRFAARYMRRQYGTARMLPAAGLNISGVSHESGSGRLVLHVREQGVMCLCS